MNFLARPSWQLAILSGVIVGLSYLPINLGFCIYSVKKKTFSHFLDTLPRQSNDYWSQTISLKMDVLATSLVLHFLVLTTPKIIKKPHETMPNKIYNRKTPES